MNGYGPYYMPQMQSPYMQDQQALQQRIDQLSQMQNQYKQPMQTRQPNVNWIQVNGVDGARNQIVQPGGTSWMMDNNAPRFYVKSVDNMGGVNFKAFEFKEIQPNEAPQTVTTDMDNRYVTREEFERFLSNIKARPEEKGEVKHE